MLYRRNQARNKKFKLAVGAIVVLVAVFLGAMVASAGTTVLVKDPLGVMGGRSTQGQAKAIKASFMRTFVLWENIEPVKGTYNFASTDLLVQQSQKKQLDQVITLVDINSWGGSLDAQQANTDGIATYNGYPEDPAAWLDFVGAMVERYDGDGNADMPNLTRPVKNWQVENEWLWKWLDSADMFVLHTKDTVMRIKTADSKAKVIGGALSGVENAAFVDGYFPDRTYIDDGTSDATRVQLTLDDLVSWTDPNHPKRQRLATFIKGTKGYLDYQDVHSYSVDPYVIPGENQWIRDQYAIEGYQPILVSLENAGPMFDYSEAEHANQVVTRAMIGIENGYAKYTWATLYSNIAWYENSKRVSLIDSDTNYKKPAYYTFGVMGTLLEGVSSIERIDQADPEAYVYRAVTPKGSVYVAWHKSGQSQVSVPLTGVKANLVHIIVTPGQTYPTIETIAITNNEVTVPITTEPIFVIKKK